MAKITQLQTDRARACAPDLDVLGRLRFWSQDLHSRGLHAEAMLMTDAANELEELRQNRVEATA